MKTAATIALLILLAACGSRTPLKPAPGNVMPVKPETAAVTPTAEELMTPSVQARPKRSDEQLKRSEERQDDRFDLPPTG